MVAKQNMSWMIRWMASGFGVGFVPCFPGTAGSLLGLLLVFVFSGFSAPLFILTVITFTIFSIWVAQQAALLSNEEDPQWVVIDEMIGMLFALAFLPMHWRFALGGFLLFRFFDMTKLWPVGTFEKLPGGWGIVMDDVVAGILANLALRGIAWLL